MNKVILMGRLTRDPDIRSTAGAQPQLIARYTLAVDRRVAPGAERQADFISCVAFGKSAEFAEKYLRKGIKIAVTGRIQTGSYTNKDGQTVYTTDVLIEEQEFAESKNASGSSSGAGTGTGTAQAPMPQNQQNQQNGYDWTALDQISDDEMPFGP